jgi:hypothetical protein
VYLGRVVPSESCAAWTFHRKAVAGSVNERIRNESSNRIHAEYQNWHRPSTAPSFDLQYPVQKSEEDESEATGKEDERTGPQMFVDREPYVPNFTGD